MAASRVELLEIEPLQTSLQFWDENPSRESFTADGSDIQSISTANVLGGARGALVAVGLEAVAVLGFYSLTHLWRLMR